MAKEKSCGAIVYNIDDDHPYYLILKHKAGHWSFPKGHVEGNETEIETALREIKEETGLKVTIDTRIRLINQYQPTTSSFKEVVYFIAKANTNKVICQQEEIESYCWCLFSDAIKLITYENDKRILVKMDEYLRNET